MSLHYERNPDMSSYLPPPDAPSGEPPGDNGLEVRRWLRQAQVRPTALRIMVIRTLLAAPQPLPAEALHRHLHGLGETLCVASVYRVLRELEAGGLLARDIHKTRIGTKSLYRVANSGRPATRYTMACPHCARRRPLSDALLVNQLSNAALGEGFHLPAEITLSLPCVRCLAQQQIHAEPGQEKKQPATRKRASRQP